MFAAAFGTECNGMCLFNSKHLLVCANNPPDWTKTEIDRNRFEIYKITKEFDITEVKDEYSFLNDI